MEQFIARTQDQRIALKQIQLLEEINTKLDRLIGDNIKTGLDKAVEAMPEVTVEPKSSRSKKAK